MNLKLRRWGVLQGNKNELYFSVMVVVIGVLLTAHSPAGFFDVVLLAASFLIGFVCSINALLDARQMNWVERIFALLWFTVLLFVTPQILWHAFTMQAFADC